MGRLGDGRRAAGEALNRPYMVHTDCVDEVFVLQTARHEGLAKRAKARVLSHLLRWWHYPAIARAALSLCHGHDTYEAYKGLNPHSFIIHNVHTSHADLVTPEQLGEKLARAKSAGPLKVCYAGRIAAEKAPVAWVQAIDHAIRQGADIQATWYGDGEMREQMEAAITERNLGGRIHLPGFTTDRQALLTAMRESDVFVFTHITRESPRCLLESLITGTPIVGYDSHFAEDLISKHGGGVLTSLHEPITLGNTLAELARDRSKLAALINSAALDGDDFTSEAVFRHRAELIKTYLPPLPAEVGEAGASGITHEGVGRHRELSDGGSDDRVPAVTRR